MTKTDKTNDHKWYVVLATSGQENKSMELLKQRIIVNNMQDQMSEVFIPTQNKMIIKAGKKKKVTERIFPGYLLVKMKYNNETRHIIIDTEGILGFAGSSTIPIPLNEKEVKRIIHFSKIDQPTYESSYNVGDTVKIIEGPFKNIIGHIQNINPEKGQATVLISIFGAERPIHNLDILQISHLK